ncbi:hypothetical protein BKP45_03130 [Anaerobacillus alkalidiazotrophicus]|uniref:DUF1659 domain-containing protein n=2 Tax=Anaerobacillus TaxID=704093 RepID=A0A1S2MCZ1_9BACI|nr:MULTISPECIES: DUF1659 domain-containing protein [Anaerobacillus]OIJ14274.1 hypothetical protein BKP37_08850 [Anaerobacillus alkalilacustris]OIJ14284.1 hypothetical protein BKP37_08905 [Anaerobacillus alkalilacustris]OIJ21707.1 hypothetical protein BKP45_03130 [Anaerobacillus alkalidiazotrophicus]
MNENIMQTRLSLVFHGGFDDEGKEILVTKNFSNIDITATSEQLKNTAQALATLQQFTLEGVTRNNVYDVLN